PERAEEVRHVFRGQRRRLAAIPRPGRPAKGPGRAARHERIGLRGRATDWTKPVSCTSVPGDDTEGGHLAAVRAQAIGLDNALLDQGRAPMVTTGIGGSPRGP